MDLFTEFFPGVKFIKKDTHLLNDSEYEKDLVYTVTLTIYSLQKSEFE